ncbi:MAG: signal peptidase II [Verrucomicrobiales bacterium]|nr:signal peptidase II [Verrucomicrobiales bacterium]
MRLFLYLSLPLFLLDQLTKLLIVQNFPDPREGGQRVIEVIPGFFNLVRVHNTGMAFGMFNGNPYSNWIFGAIGITAISAIVIFWKKGAFPDRISKTAAALLVSGIAGNLFDRALPGRGYVVDFLDFILPFYDKIDSRSGGHFPSFNVADSCICIAAGLLIISAFRQPKEEEKTAAE